MKTSSGILLFLFKVNANMAREEAERQSAKSKKNGGKYKNIVKDGEFYPILCF
jgi:hypothetical protein